MLLGFGEEEEGKGNLRVAIPLENSLLQEQAEEGDFTFSITVGFKRFNQL